MLMKIEQELHQFDDVHDDDEDDDDDDHSDEDDDGLPGVANIGVQAERLKHFTNMTI